MRAASTITMLLAAVLACRGLGLADEPVQQRKRQQQAAVDLARRLIADVLDVQLAQFQDNGLDTLPVYRDIQAMRINIDRVTEEDMQRIISLLNQAQQAGGETQTKLVTQARQNAREVVTVLMAERERLRQRLKVAHIQQQLRQLIEQQQRVRSDTAQLDATPREQRDRATVAALEDQRDARTLFDQLDASLETARQWESAEGQAAEASKRRLQDEGTAALFKDAESDLAKGDTEHALQAQDAIVEQLSEVLEKMETAQGLKPFDSSSALDAVDDILQQQKELTEQTGRASGEDQGQLDELSRQQHGLHEQMGDLDQAAQALPDGSSLLNQAKAAALGAEEDLFAGDPDAAVEDQQQVIRNLEQLRRALNAASSAAQPADMPDPLEMQVEQLEELSQDLAEIAQQQDQVLAELAESPTSARQQQQEVAGALSEQSARDPLPNDVQQSVENAAQLAARAAETMQDTSPSNGAARSEAARGAQQAIRAAQARAASQLQAARRAMQSPGAQPLAQSATSRSPGDSRSGESAKLDPAASAQSRNAPRPSNSEMTDPNALSSRRTVGDAQRSDRQDEALGGRSYVDTPWFARLPPELREAIRMRGRRQPPRGYEDRLRRYFQSVDK